ncbi:M28 family peptidase [Tautonia rosea]|uniref:M28 family peptidase n=1 Tax=Tautonia rosea TaxID=2728037 RepID=UPI001475D748|nr:M28 family peptidase [Tautonia rosea]
MNPSTYADRFDGHRAMNDLIRLCSLGPRPAGSEAMERQRGIVAEAFRSHGAEVSIQEFEGVHPLSERTVRLANVVGSWRPERPDRVLIGGHGDTRPRADRERDPTRVLGPFLGANDGASGVAALMELARHLTELPGSAGVDLVMFDAEELVFDEVGDYCLGSCEFALRARNQERAGGPSYAAAVVLDMIAGREMCLTREGFGRDYAAWLTEDLWNVARNRGTSRFSDDWGHYVEDDHLPLLGIGVPAIALVDLDYPQWHTLDDRPEACDVGAIEAVGRVVLEWLGRWASLPESPGKTGLLDNENRE